jgi:hypothetical protein
MIKIEKRAFARSRRRARACARGGKANVARLNVRRAAQVERYELASVTNPSKRNAVAMEKNGKFPPRVPLAGKSYVWP